MLLSLISSKYFKNLIYVLSYTYSQYLNWINSLDSKFILPRWTADDKLHCAPKSPKFNISFNIPSSINSRQWIPNSIILKAWTNILQKCSKQIKSRWKLLSAEQTVFLAQTFLLFHNKLTERKLVADKVQLSVYYLTTKINISGAIASLIEWKMQLKGL